ncbi:MAG: DUF423 domain-containing protein [Gloeobacterales cyanobacterium]
MNRVFFSLGALFALLSVVAGAFGAHWLKNQLDVQSLEIFQTAARYQMYHALALLVLGWVTMTSDNRMLLWAGWCFTAGILIFSGSLYGLSLSGIKILGAVAPLGGLSLMAGWGILLTYGLTQKA